MNQVWHVHSQRVRYQETDQMGVVYHANYLTWFEIGRTEWIRQQGVTYQSIEERGLLLPLLDAAMSFRLPARYDDWITLFTRLVSYSPLKLQFEVEVRRLEQSEHLAMAEQLQREGKPYLAEDGRALPGELLVSGSTNHVWLNREWKPVRLEKQYPELYSIFRYSGNAL